MVERTSANQKKTPRMIWIAAALLLPLASAHPQFPGGPSGGFPGGPMGPPPPGAPGFPPPPPKELPPGFEAVLPAEVVQQLKAIHESDTMPAQEKHEKIDAIMVNLPGEVLDRLPQPPGFDRLPEETREALKNIHRDKSITFRQRLDQIHALISALPESVRRLLPMGPPPPQAFQRIPQASRDALRDLKHDSSLGHRERYHKIKAIMDSLPEDVRSLLPPAPPAPLLA